MDAQTRVRRLKRGVPVVSMSDFQNHDIYTVVASTLVDIIKGLVDSEQSLSWTTIEATAELVCCFSRLSQCSVALCNACRTDATIGLYSSFVYHARLSMYGNPNASKITTRFYDGFSKVSLLTGCAGVGPHADMHRFNALGVKDIVQDRFKTAKKLCDLDTPRLSSACNKYVPTDLPSGTGRRVASFLGRARLLAQHAARNNPSLTCSCNHFECLRPMLDMYASGTAASLHSTQASVQDVFGVQAPVANAANAFDDNSSEDEEDEDATIAQEPTRCVCTGYWASACPGVVTALPPRKFCSLACFQGYTEKLRFVLPISAQEVESYEATCVTAGKIGLARIASACRAAFKRNTAIARTLRLARRSSMLANNVVDEDLASRIHSNIVDMLNVDLGMLCAAAYIAESPSASIARVLPGTYDDWRSETRKWTRPLEIVKGLYLQHFKNRHILVYDETRLPPWLSKVREKATLMFPVQALE